MASPQRENGFVQLARDLSIALGAARLGEAQRLILTVVLDQLYGPRKFQTAILDVPGLAASAGITPTNLYRALRGLIESRLIIKAKHGRFAFNKDYETWMRDGSPMLTQAMIKFAQGHDRGLEKVITGDHSEPEIGSPKVINGDHTERSPVITKVINGDHSPYRNGAGREDSGRLEDDDEMRARDSRTKTPEPNPALTTLVAWLTKASPEDLPAMEPLLATWLIDSPPEQVRAAIELALVNATAKGRKGYTAKVLREWRAHPERYIRPAAEAEAVAGPRKPSAPRKPEPSPYAEKTAETQRILAEQRRLADEAAARRRRTP